MELPAESPYLEHPVHWTFTNENTSLFEIDLEALRVPMPHGSYPLEIRPGVGLVGIGGLLGAPGGLGHLPAFVEINWFVMLNPDLSWKLPVPRFSMLTCRIASDCEAFVNHATDVDRLPVYRSRSLRGTFDTEAFRSSFEDDDGPIFSLVSTHRDAPQYIQKTGLLQLRSREGGRWQQAVIWSGPAFEHQQGHHGGIIHQHPFFEGLDVRGLGDRCYMRFINQPGYPAKMIFHAPVRRGDGPPGLASTAGLGPTAPTARRPPAR